MSERPVVLITGVSGGIGYATAEVFHRAGWFVIGADKREVEDKLGVVGRFFQIDIADPHQIDALVESIVTNESRLDALVNNAAIQVCKSFIETTLEEWDLVMNVNLRSMFWLSRQAYSLLKATKGSIVNVSSVHAVATSKNIAAYAASKGAVVAMTRAMAIEFS